MDVQVEDISEQTAALALQGPASAKLLKTVAEADIANLKYFRKTSGKIAGVPVDISRTGYTGDLGYEIWIPWNEAVKVWDALMDKGRQFDIHAAGMLALDVSRVEAGLLLIEVDYTSSKKALIPSQKYSPYELGFGKMVHLDKENFIGKARAGQRQQRWRHAAVGRPRSGLGGSGRAVRQVRTLPGSAQPGFARCGAHLCGREARRQGDDDGVLSTAEKVNCAGQRGHRVFQARHQAANGINDRSATHEDDCDGSAVAVLQSEAEDGDAGVSAAFARRFPAQYSHTPISTSAPQPPTILKTASGLFGSSGGGRTDRAMVNSVVANPRMDSACAAGFPPGTRITSSPAGSPCSLNIDANKYKYGMKYVITPMLTSTS